MRLLVLSLILVLLQIEMAFAYERSDAFIVRIFDKRIRVLSPSKFDPNLSVIIENKTLVSSISKLVRKNGKLIKHISVRPGKYKAVKLKVKKGEVIYFVPISPPFQKVNLIPGGRAYEIPPKR